MIGIYINGGKIIALGEEYNKDWASVKEINNQSFVYKSFDDMVDKDSSIVVVCRW